LLFHHGFKLWPQPLRAPSVTSNFSKNQFYRQPNPLTFSRAKWQRWVQNLRNYWRNCNLQFSFNYTKYYTFGIYWYKSLIYKYFRLARLSANQGFCEAIKDNVLFGLD